jgi:predicted neuraminidase
MSLLSLALLAQAASPLVQVEFIYERAPFPEAHASTIVETPDGLVAAWFGGTAEGRPDVGIWLSRRTETGWSAPVEVARGTGRDGRPVPTWNPVLFLPTRGPLLLFYKVGSSPDAWWTIARTSSDNGRSWSDAVPLPKGVLGPIRAKPVELPDGTLLAGSSTEDRGWVVHMERYDGSGLGSEAAWQKTGPLNDPKIFEAIQPTILVHSATKSQILCRSRQHVITEASSDDGGRTWTSMKATRLPNPSAGIDAVRLADGRFLLAYNPTPSGRRTLEIAVSTDGETWRQAVTLEDAPGEYSYPAMIQTRDGLVHVTYTWNRRRIRHVVVDPARIP